MARLPTLRRLASRIYPGLNGAHTRKYLRNNHGATTAAAFSARSRPGLGVSMPIAWDDLASLKRSDQWTVSTAREHLSFQTADPWQDYWTCKQTLRAGL